MEKDWLAQLTDKRELMRLIQGNLGCGCPDDVFEHYRVQFISSAKWPMVQLILGNRLLVWIMDGMKMDNPEKRIPPLLKEGRLKRDNLELNRFRLVVVGRVSESRTDKILKESASIDEKVHLHALSPLFWGGITDKMKEI